LRVYIDCKHCENIVKNKILLFSLLFYCSIILALKHAERTNGEIIEHQISDISLSMSLDKAKHTLASHGFKLAVNHSANVEQKTWEYSKANTDLIISESMNGKYLSLIDSTETAQVGKTMSIEGEAAKIVSSWRAPGDESGKLARVCQTRSGITGKSAVIGVCNIVNMDSGEIAYHPSLNMMQTQQRLVRNEIQ